MSHGKARKKPTRTKSKRQKVVPIAEQEKAIDLAAKQAAVQQAADELKTKQEMEAQAVQQKKEAEEAYNKSWAGRWRRFKYYWKWKNVKNRWPLVTRKRYETEQKQMSDTFQNSIQQVQQNAARDVRAFKDTYAPAARRLVKVHAIRDRVHGGRNHEIIHFGSEVDFSLVHRGQSYNEKRAIIDVLADGVRDKVREIMEQKLPRPEPPKVIDPPLAKDDSQEKVPSEAVIDKAIELVTVDDLEEELGKEVRDSDGVGGDTGEKMEAHMENNARNEDGTPYQGGPGGVAANKPRQESSDDMERKDSSV